MKVYIKFLANLFFKCLLYVTCIMFSLVFILNYLGELDFFQNIEMLKFSTSKRTKKFKIQENYLPHWAVPVNKNDCLAKYLYWSFHSTNVEFVEAENHFPLTFVKLNSVFSPKKCVLLKAFQQPFSESWSR